MSITISVCYCKFAAVIDRHNLTSSSTVLLIEVFLKIELSRFSQVLS